MRADKIIVSRTGSYFEKDAIITTTLEGFSIDGNIIEGTRVIKNLGLNENNHHKFQLTLTNGHIIFNDETDL